MSLRDYVHARALVENAESPEKIQMTPSIEKVLEIQAELAFEDQVPQELEEG